MTGKEKCEILKAMRREIAEANGIIYLSADCTYQGDCRGYCPKCDAEAKYLDSELNRLAKEGKELKITNFAYQSFLNAPSLSEEQSDTKSNNVGCMVERGAESIKDMVLSMPIEELDMSVRSYNCLKRADINTVKDLIGKTYSDLLKIHNLGRNGADEIIHKLYSLGLDLKEEDDDFEMGFFPLKELR